MGDNAKKAAAGRKGGPMGDKNKKTACGKSRNNRAHKVGIWYAARLGLGIVWKRRWKERASLGSQRKGDVHQSISTGLQMESNPHVDITEIVNKLYFKSNL